MLKITYEINGRKTTPGSLKNAIEAAVLSGIEQNIKKSIGSVRCREHGQHPSILVKGRSQETLSGAGPVAPPASNVLDGYHGGLSDRVHQDRRANLPKRPVPGKFCLKPELPSWPEKSPTRSSQTFSIKRRSVAAQHCAFWLFGGSSGWAASFRMRKLQLNIKGVFYS